MAGISTLSAAVASVLVLSGAASALVVSDSRVPDASEIAKMVDIASILSIAEDLQAFGSRDFHLESSSDAADYIYSGFHEMGISVEFQEFAVGSTTAMNVVAIIPGKGTEWFLFGAHYDSVNRDAESLTEAEDLPAPGADDDASGVAIVMEMARILANVDAGLGIKFVAFGAEEYGYDNAGGRKGSEYFVEQEVVEGAVYKGSVILDMVGYRAGNANKGSLVTNTDGDEFARACVQAAADYAIDVELEVLCNPNATYSDHASFWSAGIPSVLATEELCQVTGLPINPYYHTAYDTADRLSGEQMEAIAQTILAGFLITIEESDSSFVSGIGLAAAILCVVAVLVLFSSRRKRGECKK